jgi:hypothetical protein
VAPKINRSNMTQYIIPGLKPGGYLILGEGISDN